MVQDISAVCDEHLSRGENMVLVRITQSDGSTPREAGAAMVVTKDGRVAGTVGGGALELACEQIAADVLRTGVSEARAFSLGDSNEKDLGMLCGGDVAVSFQFVDAADPVSVEAGRAACAGNTKQRVWVFGGGHVAQALVPVLAELDFDCVVLDDREEYADPALFPGASDVRRINPEHVLAEADIQKGDYVAIMTHGHANDLLIQSQVMRSPASYIGVIGSRRKTAALTEKLHAMGFTASDFGNVFAPIGIPIPSETPAEIAISIAAQLITMRAEGAEAARRAASAAEGQRK